MKRGISAIISTVLLIGFAIAMALMVFTWSKGHTEKVTESAVDFVEGEMMCGQVGLNVAGVGGACSKLSVANTGYLTVEKVAVRSLDMPERATDMIEMDPPLLPGATIEISGLGATKTEVIPIIKKDEKLIGCKEKRIILEC